MQNILVCIIQKKALPGCGIDDNQPLYVKNPVMGGSCD